MYLLLVVLPFLNFIYSGILGRFLGRFYMRVLILINMFFSFILSIVCFYEVGILKYRCILYLFNWIDLGFLQLDFGFFFDSLTVTMLVLVVFVSFLVHLYSLDYMSNDPHLVRFLGYLSLFTFFMVLLVTSSNFIQLFFG